MLYLEMRDVPWEGQVFPVAAIALLALCALALGIRGLLKIKKCPGDLFKFFGDVAPQKWLVIVFVFSFYVLFAMLVSFLVGTFLFALFMPLFLENTLRIKNILAVFVFSSGLTLFFHFFFIKLMHINFPGIFYNIL